MGKGKKKRTGESVARLPKKKCCESKPRCGRCPLRMLKEGTIPEGYTVHKRKLVKVEDKADRQLEKSGKSGRKSTAA